MLTPWFAGSVGIVIATMLTVVRPHPAITFPPSVTGRCAKPHCAVPSPSPSPSAPGPAIKHEVILPSPRPDGNVKPAAVKVEYRLLSSHGNHFMAVILIVSHHSLGVWQLSFSLPRATIHDIMWVQWKQDGRDGVIVKGSPAPWAGSAGRSSANEARMIISGSGTPAWPVGCQFNGTSCRFRALSQDIGHMYIKNLIYKE